MDSWKSKRVLISIVFFIAVKNSSIYSQDIIKLDSILINYNYPKASQILNSKIWDNTKTLFYADFIYHNKNLVSNDSLKAIEPIPSIQMEYDNITNKISFKLHESSNIGLVFFSSGLSGIIISVPKKDFIGHVILYKPNVIDSVYQLSNRKFFYLSNTDNFCYIENSEIKIIEGDYSKVNTFDGLRRSIQLQNSPVEKEE